MIIFDWDDVFIMGAIQGHFACYRQALVDIGMEPDQAELERTVTYLWGRPHQVIFQALLDSEHKADLAAAVGRYQTYKDSKVFLSKLQFVSGGQEFLRNLAQHYTLALATSQQRKLLVQRIFPLFQVPDVFSTIMSSHDFNDPGQAKPSPYMVEEIMRTHAAKQAETIVVGDAKNDVLMAQAAGVKPVVVLTGHLTEQQAKELGVQHIIPDVIQLESVLQALRTE
ncbi:MAG TPA: HAD-IA family hydrolase [Candidatus Saccharimonadales bacterium]|nr:HAD-IA family hydrolase [Candidatus Saccharimonadales bacterium]